MDDHMVMAIAMIVALALGVFIGYFIGPEPNEAMRKGIVKQREINAKIASENKRLRRSNAQYRYNQGKN